MSHGMIPDANKICQQRNLHQADIELSGCIGFSSQTLLDMDISGKALTVW